MSTRCKACNRKIDTYDITTPLNTQILESVYDIDPYATEDASEYVAGFLLEQPQPLYPTMNDLEGRPEEDLCTGCRTHLIESAQRGDEYQFEDLT
jgi:hypothetical protein